MNLIMKNSLLILLIGIGLQSYGQTIFKGLEYGMTEKEAKKEFKENRDAYINIDVGNGFKYRIYRQNFEFWKKDKLTGVVFSPKGAAFGLSYDNTVLYLEYTRGFLEDLDYTVYFEPEFWNGPLHFNSKYGLLMVNPEKTVVAQLYPIQVGNTLNVILELFNYSAFMENYDAASEQRADKIENSGF